MRSPFVGEVIVADEAFLLVVGSTNGGHLTVRLDKPVEISDLAVCNGNGKIYSLEHALQLLARKDP
jgi:hypothetical protein